MAKTTKCPECGEAFDPRGLKPHRWAKHQVKESGAAAVASKPESTTAAALQDPAKERTPEKVATESSPAASPAAAAAPVSGKSFFERLGDW